MNRLIAIIAVLISISARSQVVFPDSTFNQTGVSVFQINGANASFGYDAVALPDGKILMSGAYKYGQYFNIGLVKFNPDGQSFDNSFGVNGLATASLGDQMSVGGIVNKIRLDGAGKIYVLGYGAGTGEDMFICRFLPNGTLDPSFDGDGRAFIDIAGTFEQPDAAYDFNFDQAGNIYLTGATRMGALPNSNELTVAKITPSGALDPSFSGDGKAIYDLIPNQWDWGYGIAVQSDNKILISGFSGIPADFYVLRLNPDGTFDNTFGTAGKTTVDIFGANVADQATNMMVQPDGKILVIGYGMNPVIVQADAAIVRLNPNGSIDNTFGGGDGIATFDLTGTNTDDILNDIMISNGKYLCGGYVSDGAQQRFVVARVNIDGSLDMTFNNSGKFVWSPSGINDDVVYGLDVTIDGKIILAGLTDIDNFSWKYAIMRLNAGGAVAGFTANNTTVCIGSSVQFTSTSIGENITHQWQFEGGIPATSTLQNPVVQYNSTGVYDVQLIVFNSFSSDTLLMPDMITVVQTPASPSAITGPTSLCSNQTGSYSVDPVQYATGYVWSLIPNQAGSLTTNMNNATFIPSVTYAGSFTIQVTAVNSCGSSGNAVLNGQVGDSPDIFQLSGPGYYCEGTTGQTLTLSDSETGINYELYLDEVPTGNLQAGTGESISWQSVTEQGFYTVHASTTGNCAEVMAGQVYNELLPLMGTPSTPAGDTDVCAGENNTYTTSGITGYSVVAWTLDPQEAGTMNASGLQVIIDWNPAYSGSVSLTVQAENECGPGGVSDPLMINVNAMPQPSLSGPDMVCLNKSYEYQTTATGSLNWDVTGGTIVSGAGTSSIIVNWTIPGDGVVSVTETSAENCPGTTSLDVTVDPCTSVEDYTLTGGLYVYPNPAGEKATVVFRNEKPCYLRLVDVTGRALETVAISETGEHSVIFDLTGYQKGYYTLQLISEMKLVGIARLARN